MRLTNKMRDDFVNSVMESVKFKVKYTKDGITAEISKRAMLSLPQEVQDFVKKYPQHVQFISVNIEFMSYRVSENGMTWFEYPKASMVNGTAFKDLNLDDLKAGWAAHRKELADRESMQARLMEVAKSVTTTEALEKVFPKLLKHIPRPVVEKKSLPVAATGLMTELVQLGLEQP